MRLPVRTALLQNRSPGAARMPWCDYQSERHCSKTSNRRELVTPWCDYQSERHCSKTLNVIHPTYISAITSQNGTAPKRSGACLGTCRVRLPVRTALLQNPIPRIKDKLRCDYQSERHCSKTAGSDRSDLRGAITSQNGTAPKPTLT